MKRFIFDALERAVKTAAQVAICQRNGIKRLSFTGDSAGNLTQHCFFQATQCPGPYLKSKFPYIADEVNKRLEAALQEDETMTGKQIAEALMQYQATNWDGSGEDGSRFANFLETAITGRQGYADVPDWARKEFDEAVKLGITDGTSPGVFIPRYQAAIMAVRARNAAGKA